MFHVCDWEPVERVLLISDAGQQTIVWFDIHISPKKLRETDCNIIQGILWNKRNMNQVFDFNELCILPVFLKTPFLLRIIFNSTLADWYFMLAESYSIYFIYYYLYTLLLFNLVFASLNQSKKFCILSEKNRNARFNKLDKAARR